MRSFSEDTSLFVVNYIADAHKICYYIYFSVKHMMLHSTDKPFYIECFNPLASCSKILPWCIGSWIAQLHNWCNWYGNRIT